MFPSHLTFERTLEAVSAHLEFLRREQMALKIGAGLAEGSNHAERALRDLALAAERSTPKRFVHTWAVVELYGAIEHYIEGLIRDYLLRIQGLVARFTDLPPAIVKAHTRKSFEFLQSAEKVGLTFSESEVVANLHSCATASGTYKLNRDAFTMHTANFRTEQLRTAFSEIGIDAVPRRAYQTDVFQLFLGTLEGSRSKNERRSGQELLELDELVDFRNEAAHGVPSNFLSLDLLEGYVAFARAFGYALLEIVEEAATRIAACNKGKPAGSVVAVYRSEIVCLRLEHPASVGDTLIARTPDDNYRSSRIRRMEISGHAVPGAVVGDVVGIEVAFHAKENQTFFLIPEEVPSPVAPLATIAPIGLDETTARSDEEAPESLVLSPP